MTDGSLDDLKGANTIAVFDDTAADNGWSVGDTITVEFPATGKVDLQVVALYSENGLIGDYALSLDTFDANVAQQLDIFVLVKAAEGADLSAVRGGHRDRADALPERRGAGPGRSSATSTRRSSTRS